MLRAEVRFTQPDLGADRVMFAIRTGSPRWGTHDTLFLADPETRELTQLTHFPERLAYLPGKKVLQLQNRFGVFYSDDSLSTFRPSPLFPSFTEDGRMLQGSLTPLSISPNGRYLLYVESRSPAFGVLYFIDLDNGERRVVSDGIQIDLQATPAVWAPDSSFFVYGKRQILYYMSVRQLGEGKGISEEFRQIGAGAIGNISPGARNALYYLTDSLVYELAGSELFTRALYRGYLSIGRLVGKIPFAFDPNFDSFWVSADGRHVLLDKGGRNLFVYRLSTEDFSSTGESESLPYLYLSRNACIKRVLWDDSGLLTVLAAGLENGREKTRIFRVQTARIGSDPSFQQVDVSGVMDMQLSPDKRQVALLFADRVEVRDYGSFGRTRELEHPRVQQIAWISETRLVVAGAYTIEEHLLEEGRKRLLWISQPGSYAFTAQEDAVAAVVGEHSYTRVLGASSEPGAWSESTAQPGLRPRRTSSDSHRVYLEEVPDRVYGNMLMIRDRRKLVTTAVLEQESGRLEPFPAKDDPLDFETFDHGSRIRRREISLVFNVIGSVEGLPAVLSALDDYNLRCTFFVNGEAIGNYPDAIREIAESGHEVGSLFSMHFDMTDARFRLDKEFIKRGMAQNEDAFFTSTGRELSLLWHAPYYFVNSDILQASREMNYVYVGRDVDPLDWATRDMSITTRDIYYPSATLVERVISAKKPGSIVPILVGKPEGNREDYLFHVLDLLVDALIKRGYEIVPVSVLIEHAE